MKHQVEAVMKGSPFHFKISQGFASDCIGVMGSVVHHPTLGPMFCDEAVLHANGHVHKMVFVGTSNKNGLRV